MAGIFALPSNARSIGVDGTMICSSVVPSTGTLFINLGVINKKGNFADSGVNFTVLMCDSPGGSDINGNPTPGLNTTLTPLSYDPAASALYTWVDLGLTQGITPSELLSPSDLASPSPGPLGLSSFSDFQVGIPAMVNVFRLTGSYSGDYEILFNYQTTTVPMGVTTCNNVLQSITPSFVWFGKTYIFTGAGGVGPCDANSTNDFLFGPNGQLLGHNSATSFGVFTLTGGLPPGWIVLKL
jgi:hypothetical protein